MQPPSTDRARPRDDDTPRAGTVPGPRTDAPLRGSAGSRYPLRPNRGDPLRIAILIERFVPEAGGVENVAWQVAHGLARAGEAVTVFAREHGDGPTADDHPSVGTGPTDEGVVLRRRVRAPRAWQPLRVLAFARGAARATGRRPDGRGALRSGFDVVHSFSRTWLQDVYRAGGGSHADYLDRMHPGRAGRLRRLSPRHRVLLEIERRVFADARQRIQCPSRLVADELARRHGVASDRLLVLPNGVDHRRFCASANRSAGLALRRRIEGDGGPVWLLPASGWRRKGLDTVLAAWARPGTGDARLWVAGRDDPRPWRARAARLGVAGRVRFLGPRTDLETVYAAVDGVVLPTRYDPFANVTLEAAAAGLPIVTSAANGAAEWLGDALVEIADAEDPEALADAVAGLSAPEHRRALGDRALRRVAPLTWEAHVDALRAEYARRAAERGTGPVEPDRR